MARKAKAPQRRERFTVNLPRNTAKLLRAAARNDNSLPRILALAVGRSLISISLSGSPAIRFLLSPPRVVGLFNRES